MTDALATLGGALVGALVAGMLGMFLRGWVRASALVDEALADLNAVHDGGAGEPDA